MQHGHTAGKFGETFLEFLAVVVAGGLGNLGLYHGHAGGDGFEDGMRYGQPSTAAP